MLTALFFLAAFATIGTLIWAGLQLIQPDENPLADRLQELQSSAMVTASPGRTPRRTGKGGFLNWVLYIVSVIPGGEDWIDENEKELNQGGIRDRKAVALYALFNLAFLAALTGGAVWLQQGKPASQILIGLMAPIILGILLPKQVLHRLVKRYRGKLQEALPDTVDLLGIVLGTRPALDPPLPRLTQQIPPIYPHLPTKFSTLAI